MGVSDARKNGFVCEADATPGTRETFFALPQDEAPQFDGSRISVGATFSLRPALNVHGTTSLGLGRWPFDTDRALDTENPVRIGTTPSRLRERIHQLEPYVLARRYSPVVAKAIELSGQLLP
jgi:hypothetical protein